MDFFIPSRTFTVRDVSLLTGAELLDPSAEGRAIKGLKSTATAGDGDLAFISSRKFAQNLGDLVGVVVLCPPDITDLMPPGAIVLTHKAPQNAFAQVGRAMFPETEMPAGATSGQGVSERAHVDATARLEPGVTVEPGAVIGPGVEIGARTVIAANAVIGANCRIGRDGYVGPSASIRYAILGDRVAIHAGAVIGRDGFGFVFAGKAFERMPQLGRVVLQDGVEIGANSTVDRGALEDTVIGEGTKIDNLVQIAHNVKIGRNCVIAAHCGLSGSVVLGDLVMLGGRVGVADHVRIGNGVQLAASSGVMDDIPDGERWMGIPAVPIRDFFRQVATIRKLSARKRGETE